MQQKKNLEKKDACSVRESVHKQACNSARVEGSREADEKWTHLSWSLVNGDKKELVATIFEHQVSCFQCTKHYDRCFI